jgi:signal transduction histidine kinase
MKVNESGWFNRFWAVAGAVNIRNKILGIVLGLVLLMGLTVTWQVRSLVARTMYLQLEESAVSITHDLAARSTDPILINNLYALHELLNDTRANNASVRYALIVSPEGDILAHTFGTGFPASLLEANSATSDDYYRMTVLDTDEGPIWDTAVPIFGGRAGTARVGLSDARLRQTIDTVTGQLLLTTVIVSALGISAAALLTWVLTRPVLDLVQATQAVGEGDFSHRVRRWADDEVGDLADAFNSMTVELAKAAEERAERDQLRAQYVSAVIAAQEDERKRIARELHDSTSQSLTSLLIGLRTLGDTVNTPAINHHVDELRGIAAGTLEDVHALAFQLRPSVLDDLGLPEALRRHVNDCRKRYPLEIDLAIHGLDERLPPEIETALYRIIQEALTNIVRHAGAQTASILVERMSDKVLTIIDDDGSGFDPGFINASDGHLGLYGIRERAELLSGELVIESEPGSGTSLFVEIPLTMEQGAARHVTN